MKNMSGTLKVTLAVIAALFVFGVIALLGFNAQQSATSGSTSVNTTPNLNAIREKDVVLTITYTGTGFEPNTGTIQAHNTIRVRNRSTRLLKFMSNPYNKNTDELELNLGEIKPGDSKTFWISQKGVWGYHNALDPSETGTLTAY